MHEDDVEFFARSKRQQIVEQKAQFELALLELCKILSTKDIKVKVNKDYFAGLTIETPIWKADLDLMEFTRRR